MTVIWIFIPHTEPQHERIKCSSLLLRLKSKFYWYFHFVVLVVDEVSYESLT